MQTEPLHIVTLQNTPEESQRLETIFGRKEFEVKSFIRTRDMIQYIRLQPAPRCVITDLELKDYSGIELIEKIRSNQRWQNAPILVLANTVDKSMLLKLNQLKINSFIVRPYQAAKLFKDALKSMGLEVITQKTVVRKVKAQT